MTLGARLSELLDEKGLSAEALASRIGLSGSIVRRWRRSSETAIRLDHLLRVAEFFECSVDFLCGRTEDVGVFRKNVRVILSERLRFLIDESKIPVDRISKETQLDRSNMYEWLNGGRPPVSSSLIILADYFDCTVDYLLGLEN